MKAKYLKANSLEAASEYANEYFKGAQIKIDLFNTADGSITDAGDVSPTIAAAPCTVIAVEGEPHEVNNMDSFYTLYYEPDGVFLEIYSNRGAGKPLDDNALVTYIKRKSIRGLVIQAVQTLIAIGAGRAKIGPPQKELIYGEDMTVAVSPDEREASVRLLEPEEGGPSLTLEEAKKKLADNGVIHGIDEAEVKAWISAKQYGEPFVIARATMPADGENGALVFHFSTDERTGKPREVDVSGRVDYHSLDLYVPVTEGQLLVTRTPATEGTPGTTVKGQALKQKPGKEATMPRGKNVTFNDERTEMRSACSGMVEYVNNAINVSNVYNVQGDCDVSTGNIDFEGSVHISGSVRSGNIVKATDGIFVGGSVEAATLISGGNVEVKGGMQGADKGSVEAKGAVTLMFVERGKVSSDGPISVDVSIHSILETASTIQAIGRRGAIIGGRASAAGDIVASFIGALSNVKTDVVVGFMPRKRARLEELERENERLRADMVKLGQLDTYLEKSKGTLDAATWEKLYVSGVENKRQNKEAMSSIEADIVQLKQEMNDATKSKVHVLETAFCGAHVTIGPSTIIINDDINYTTFKYRDGDVISSACEKSKSDYKKAT